MRNIINKQLEQYKNKKVALLFSGGLDSLSLMISCLDVGIRPTLYSFKLEGIESDDIKASRRIANIYGLKLVEVTIPKNISTLIDDVEFIIEKFKVKKKTQIQCIQPFIHIVKYVEEDIVLGITTSTNLSPYIFAILLLAFMSSLSIPSNLKLYNVGFIPTSKQLIISERLSSPPLNNKATFLFLYCSNCLLIIFLN